MRAFSILSRFENFKNIGLKYVYASGLETGIKNLTPVKSIGYLRYIF